MRLIAYLAIFVSSAACAQVALVTDLAGRAGTLAILSEVQADSTVRLEGSMTVLYYGSGEEFHFRGPARIVFAKDAPKVLEGAAPQRTARDAKRAAPKPGGVAPATFVMRGGVTPELRARIEAARPAPNAPVAERVAFATWLEQLQLQEEARAYWKALAAERPDSQELKALAAR